MKLTDHEVVEIKLHLELIRALTRTCAYFANCNQQTVFGRPFPSRYAGHLIGPRQVLLVEKHI